MLVPKKVKGGGGRSVLLLVQYFMLLYFELFFIYRESYIWIFQISYCDLSIFYSFFMNKAKVTERKKVL